MSIVAVHGPTMLGAGTDPPPPEGGAVVLREIVPKLIPVNAAEPSFYVNAVGTGFGVDGAELLIDGVPVESTYIDSAVHVSSIYTIVGEGTFMISVRNAAGEVSNEVPLTIGPPEQLRIDSITPAGVDITDGDVLVTLTGHFGQFLIGQDTGYVTFNNRNFVTYWREDGTIECMVTSSLLLAGTNQVIVQSAWAPTSDPFPFEVTDVGAAITLTALSPQGLTGADPDQPLTVTGTGFTADCNVYFDNSWRQPVTFVSATELSVPIYPDIEVKTQSVYVMNDAGDRSNTLDYTIAPPPAARSTSKKGKS